MTVASRPGCGADATRATGNILTKWVHDCLGRASHGGRAQRRSAQEFAWRLDATTPVAT